MDEVAGKKKKGQTLSMNYELSLKGDSAEVKRLPQNALGLPENMLGCWKSKGFTGKCVHPLLEMCGVREQSSNLACHPIFFSGEKTYEFFFFLKNT